MMYGYGDAQQPLPESVDFVEVLSCPLATSRKPDPLPSEATMCRFCA